MSKENLIRDNNSGALLNNSDDTHKQYMTCFKLINKLQAEVANLKEIVIKLQNDIDSLKTRKNVDG